MSLFSPWSALFVAAALLWPPATRRWALAPLAVAWAWAWADGVIDPLAFAAPALLGLAAVCMRSGSGKAVRVMGHVLFVLLWPPRCSCIGCRAFTTRK